jgi:hypothetical protein
MIARAIDHELPERARTGTLWTAVRSVPGWSCRRLCHCGLAAVPVGRALVLPGWLCTAQSAWTAAPHSGQRNGLLLALDRKNA